MNRNQKKEFVDGFQSKVVDAPLLMLADFRGATVEESNGFRRKLEKAGVDFQVVKNTLAKLAVEGTDKEPLAAMFSGMTGVVISGEDPLTWPILAIGGKGVISVTANLVPDKFAKLVDAARTGDVEIAKALHYELLKLNDIMFIETNPIPVKAALALMGRIQNEFRAPLCPPAKESLSQLKTVLKAYALI